MENRHNLANFVPKTCSEVIHPIGESVFICSFFFLSGHLTKKFICPDLMVVFIIQTKIYFFPSSNLFSFFSWTGRTRAHGPRELMFPVGECYGNICAVHRRLVWKIQLQHLLQGQGRPKREIAFVAGEFFRRTLQFSKLATWWTFTTENPEMKTYCQFCERTMKEVHLISVHYLAEYELSSWKSGIWVNRE